jgi:hypothetical protein
MRRVSSIDFPLGSAFNKALASLLSFAVVLGPTSAVAYDDDRYSYNPPRVQDYQNQYKPQSNFSPSFQLDRQIKNQNAALLFKQNSVNPGANFKTPDLPQDTFKPKILFQLAMANPVKAPAQDLKAPQLAPPVTAKTGFLGAVQSLFKGIGAGFQRIGQAIGNAVQRMFTGTSKPGALSPQQREIIGQYPNLQPTGPNSFAAVGKPTVAFGKVWEPGSTFTSQGKDLVLGQGVSLETSFGGIKDKTGGLLPVRMTTVDGTITPVGLEFDRMRPNTTLLVTQPTAIDGFGTVHPGEMTYNGPVKSPAGEIIGGRFSFAGNKIDFNPAVGHELGMANPATLRQATFVLQAGVLRLNSVLVEKGSRAVYASQEQQPLEVGAVNNRLQTTLPQVETLSRRVEDAARDITIAATAIRSIVGNKAAKDIGLTADQADTVAQSRLMAAQAENLKADITNGDYTKADDRLNTIDQSFATITGRVTALESAAADTKALAKQLLDNKHAMREAREQTRPKTFIGRVAVGTLAVVKRTIEVVRGWVGLLEKLPVAGPVIKAAWQFKNEVMGFAFTILSGDFLDSQPKMSFDQRAGALAVVFSNGIQNDRITAQHSANKVFEAFGVSSGVRIANETHGPLGLLDFVQIIGHEYFGAYDRPVHNMVKAIRKGIDLRGEVYVVAHSQGTAIFARALELLTPAERSKIHYYGAGSEWFVDPAKHGLAGAENVWNKKDIVPSFGNYIRITNNLLPVESSRKYRPVTRVIGDDKSWREISVLWPGEGSKNYHNFEIYYLNDMRMWATRSLAEKSSK